MGGLTFCKEWIMKIKKINYMNYFFIIGTYPPQVTVGCCWPSVLLNGQYQFIPLRAVKTFHHPDEKFPKNKIPAFQSFEN